MIIFNPIDSHYLAQTKQNPIIKLFCIQSVKEEMLKAKMGKSKRWIRNERSCCIHGRRVVFVRQEKDRGFGLPQLWVDYKEFRFRFSDYRSCCACTNHGCFSTCSIDIRSSGLGFNMATIKSRDSFEVEAGKNQCGPRYSLSSESDILGFSAAAALARRP